MLKNRLVIISVFLTLNNIFYNVSNIKGEVLFWTSSGSLNLKGSKKITSTSISSNLKSVKKFMDNLDHVYVFIKIRGFNKNKKYLIKLLKQYFENTVLVHEKTSFPHNGCKKTKIRCL
uniref:ribosomal protein S11 n=1 Tax=Kappaphycus malesianus TaxID=1408293 RepID=UPI002237F157|nr:ribosomal protein S11 [Kappaphycus malesianus]UYR20477.1 ribosomal protein S11 [Kappaphycus malesianus]